jgi:hypothetical protein
MIVAITCLTINVIHENISCFSKLVWWVCVEVVDIEKLLIMKKENVLTLLDTHLLTSFFNFQVHMLIHLVQEVGLVGPLARRCMFFIKRFVTLNGFIRQCV